MNQLLLGKKRFFVFLLCCVLLLVGSGYFTPTYAEPVDTTETAQILDQIRTELSATQLLVNDSSALTDQQLLELRNHLSTLQTKATSIDLQLTPVLSSVEARLAELGQSTPEQAESEGVIAQREALTAESIDINSQMKMARLLTVEVTQALSRLGERRKEQLQAVVTERGLSVFNPQFWLEISHNFSTDWQLVHSSFLQFRMALAVESAWSKSILLVLAVGWVIGWLWVWRWFVWYLVKHSQTSRLRRSLLALGVTVLYVLIPTGVVSILLSLFTFNSYLSIELQRFAQQFIGVVAFSTFMMGLGRGLLAPRKPSWRLVKLSNEVVSAVSWVPLWVGALIIIIWPMQQLTHVMHSAMNTVLLTNSIFALSLNIVIGLALWRIQRIYHKKGALVLSTPLATSLYNVALKLMSFVVVVSLLALFLGYVALSNLIIQEVVWLTIVIFTTYLLMLLIGDLSNSILQSLKEAQTKQRLLLSQRQFRSQATLLGAGAIKILLTIIAITLAFLPFGESPSIWIKQQLSFLFQGFTFGEVTLKPAAFFSGIVVLLGGIWIVQHLRTWLADKYLPFTGLDAGMSASTAGLISYVGYVVAGVIALSAAGIGFDRMAWIVSALSVGIGFGLQAVVQNFVSGLLLLVERPIKVGDWVSLNGVEGNVVRINARATEIEMFDRSTVIVPNSEFITKVVRNVTLSNTIARVSITVVLPVNVDTHLVRKCIIEAITDTEEVLTTPPPTIGVEGFVSGGIAFNTHFFVATPRLIANVRSAVFFKILESFTREKVDLHPVQRMELVEAASTEQTNVTEPTLKI